MRRFSTSTVNIRTPQPKGDFQGLFPPTQRSVPLIKPPPKKVAPPPRKSAEWLNDDEPDWIDDLDSWKSNRRVNEKESSSEISAAWKIVKPFSPKVPRSPKASPFSWKTPPCKSAATNPVIIPKPKPKAGSPLQSPKSSPLKLRNKPVSIPSAPKIFAVKSPLRISTTRKPLSAVDQPDGKTCLSVKSPLRMSTSSPYKWQTSPMGKKPPPQRPARRRDTVANLEKTTTVSSIAPRRQSIAVQSDPVLVSTGTQVPSASIAGPSTAVRKSDAENALALGSVEIPVLKTSSGIKRAFFGKSARIMGTASVKTLTSSVVVEEKTVYRKSDAPGLFLRPPPLLKPPRRNPSLDSSSPIGPLAPPMKPSAPPLTPSKIPDLCSQCGREIGRQPAMKIAKLNLIFHTACLKCTVCDQRLGSGAVEVVSRQILQQ
ncbi:hypothetical protein BV898_12698 [Hypsibius exemplaris]|uniref:LIM zinc-binding domain-containing protein n=1 Tax=Hypsibius exemplaris TaxID=2072580 RepID=A0A1W0WCV5_HYPEX|nr:hypothetical protein BV898_12698 [Hypsibius exemplaris]